MIDIADGNAFYYHFDGLGLIGQAFKEILPEAEELGYTGVAKIDTLCGCTYATEDRKLIRVESPNTKECE